MDAKAEPILPDAIPASSGAVFLSPDEAARLFGELAASRETIARQDAELRKPSADPLGNWISFQS